MADNLIFSLVLILLLGFLGGRLAQKCKAPPLLGMILVGILLGGEVSNLLNAQLLAGAGGLRTMAVMVILMRAGLGLDREKLRSQGSVALRLGFFPALTEAIAITLISIALFKWHWTTGLLLGCVISAESPAVIVPGMLKLKNLGWGVGKGIADAILVGSALSDVLVLLIFSLLITLMNPQTSLATSVMGALGWLPFQIIGQIGLGVLVGYGIAKLIVWVTVVQSWTQNVVQDTLITATLALLLIVLGSRWPIFSSYLAIMATGFFLVKFSPPLGRRLREEFNHLWTVAEIFLFVLLGASIQLRTLEQLLLPGLIILLGGIILGRSLGWYLATWGSNWTNREKLFLLPANSAKATVQAAIGAIPLSLGIPGGETILAIAALSILVTAPLGAWGIATFAPKLLTKDYIDATQTSQTSPVVIVGAIQPNPESLKVLSYVADLTRRTNGIAVIVHVYYDYQATDVDKINLLAKKFLNDVDYQVEFVPGDPATRIVELAESAKARMIVMTKSQPHDLTSFAISHTIHQILRNTSLPVVLL